jgi:hypothetical protein
MKAANRSAATTRYIIAAATESVLGTHRRERCVETRQLHGRRASWWDQQLQCHRRPATPHLGNIGAIARDAVTIIPTLKQIMKALKTNRSKMNHLPSL